MRKNILVIVCMLLLSMASKVYAIDAHEISADTLRQDEQKVKLRFYGLVRIYNEVDTRPGSFFPSNVLMDDFGNDLNASPTSTMMTGLTTLGLEMSGPRLGNVSTSGKIECDFLGNSSADVLFRIRHAYMTLKWERSMSELLIGQTWHPFFDEVFPTVLYINDVGTFHPINRSPMLRFRQEWGHIGLNLAAVYQTSGFSSYGPDGRSRDYQSRSMVPELFAEVSYKNSRFFAGLGASWLSISPRNSAEVHTLDENGEETVLTNKVNERLSTFSFMFQAKYDIARDFSVKMKSLLISNAGHTSVPGGYGISSIDPVTGKQEYAASRYSTTWIQAVYGKKWQFGLFGGYSRNLGTSSPLVSKTYYGYGGDIRQLTGGMLTISYNIKNFSVGAEYLYTHVWYGDMDLDSGKVKDVSTVCNHRLVTRFAYTF